VRRREFISFIVKSLAITKETLIAKAEEVRVQAMENRQLSAAIAAIKEIGVLTGLRIERRERGGPGEFAEVSTEQLVSELRDMGIEVKFH
jgi:hypothetical protein